MNAFLNHLVEWLNAHPQLAGLVTFIISAAESIAIIGTIVPGSIMMTALGTLAGAGVIPLYETIIWAILGAIAGDGVSYWLGHHYKDRLPGIWPFRRYPQLLKTGEVFFHKYGYMSVFVGRFVGPVRALVPLVAGMLGMKPLRFTLANVTSAIIWGPAYMLPGILLGAASLELPPEIATQVVIALLFIILVITLILWFIYKIFQLVSNQLDALQDWIWLRLEKSHSLRFLTTVLKTHDKTATHGQLQLAFLFLFASALFIWLAIYVHYIGASHIMINDAVFHLFRGLRNPTADKYILNITLLGQKEVVLPLVIVLFIWFIIRRRWRTAYHSLALGILAAGSVFVLKNVIQSLRPWGIVNPPETFSMPSGHVILSTTVFLGLGFLLSTDLSRRKRKFIFTLCLLIVIAVGLSRLYLGTHWFTDMISGWLISCAILTVVIISYSRVYERPINALYVSSVSILTLIFTFGLFHHYFFNILVANNEMLPWPTVEIRMADWWNRDNMLVTDRVNLFGFPSQTINIEWAGNIEDIRKTLLQEGWSKPPTRDLLSTLHRITNIRSTQYLPLVSPQYLDKRPVILLTRRVIDETELLTIRLWDANRTFKNTNIKLYVGFVRFVPRAYNWLFRETTTSFIDPNLVFPSHEFIGNWEWKTMSIKRTINNQAIDRTMLLIKSKTSK